MPKAYPPEFRRKVLDLLKAGRSVAQIAFDLQISEQTIYSWRRQDRTDSGQLPGISSTEHAEPVAARRRIAELETELAIHRRAAELLKEVVPPKDRFGAIETMAGERLPVQAACRVLDVTESGYYAWRWEHPRRARSATPGSPMRLPGNKQPRPRRWSPTRSAWPSATTIPPPGR